ncbi:MAG: hypothetical protein WCH30_01020 [Chlorobiaceae bacterium]
MMKNILVFFVFTTLTLLGYVSCYALPLEGEIIKSIEGEADSFGGKLWHASYMNLTAPRNFMKGEQLKITLKGSAKWVYVRLLPEGANATSAKGIIDKRIHVPPKGVITVSLESNHPNIRQVSVHSGRQAFGKGISIFNDNADIVSIDVSPDK